MEIKKATETDQSVFAEWGNAERLDEKTCRPIVAGKRVSASTFVGVLTFSMDGYDELVGKFLYFDYNSRNHSCEFGYSLNPKYRGRGLGAKLVKSGIDYLFTDVTMNLNKIYCQTGEFNISSFKILENSGLKKDGVLREHHELDGKLWDDFIFSILRSEWNIGKEIR